MKKILLAFALFLLPSIAFAQSSPNLTYGQVPSAAQWNSYFMAKQDTLGYVPLNTNGGQMLGKLGTVASNSAGAGFNIIPGVAPSLPKDGDIWTTTAGMYVQINGSTVGPLAPAGGGIVVGTTTVGGGTSGYVLTNNSGILGNIAATTTINGQSCALSSSCTVTAAAGTLTGTTLASNVVTSSLTSVGALVGGSATTGFTINAANVTWSGQIPGTNVAVVADASGSPSTTFGVAKCDGVTITCTSGTLTAIGGTATSVTIGTTTVGGGTTTRILFNNSGILGEYQISGTGNVCMTASCTAVLSSATGLPISTGVAGLGTNVATALGTNVGSNGSFSLLVAKGTASMGTSAISSATCATVVTASATNVTTSDTINASFSGDPTATTGYVPLTTGMLTIFAYPTANNVNFKVCNNTANSITPGVIGINYNVVR